MPPQDLAKNVDTYVADRNTGAGGGDQGASWRRGGGFKANQVAVAGGCKDSKVIAELVEEVVVELGDVERLLEEMQVVEVVVVETHGCVAPSARSATDPAICELSASAANNSTKLRRRRRRRLHRMRTNHSRPVVSIALRLKSRL